jgi:exopolyphosphatase/guanosine-5'-triphosphate,3'-diphosphate pyrophosphatase
VDHLAVLPSIERAQLAGISAPRAGQSLAGALVGHTPMKLMGITEVTICPWAIREGFLLRHIEEGSAWWSDLTHSCDEGVPASPTLWHVAGPSR